MGFRLENTNLGTLALLLCRYFLVITQLHVNFYTAALTAER